MSRLAKIPDRESMLKACPYCGGRPEVHYLKPGSGSDGYISGDKILVSKPGFVVCKKCGCRSPIHSRVSLAVEKWENRAYATPSAENHSAENGRWIDGCCSACGWEEPDAVQYDGYEAESWQHQPYCPNCGKKMRGEKGETKND